jgi:hypothetical protein
MARREEVGKKFFCVDGRHGELNDNHVELLEIGDAAASKGLRKSEAI